MLGLAFALPGRIYELAFWTQLGFYIFGLAGVSFPALARIRLVSTATSFLVLNCAAWLAFWIWLLGKSSRSWTKILYSAPPAVAGGDPLTA